MMTNVKHVEAKTTKCSWEFKFSVYERRCKACVFILYVSLTIAVIILFQLAEDKIQSCACISACQFTVLNRYVQLKS